MSRSRALGLALFAVLAAGLSAVVLGRDVGDVAAPAEEPGSPADTAAGQAFAPAAAPRADSAPPKPRRTIVSGVEVVVNIPSGRLELVEGDSVVRSYPVSVGSARYPTPVGDYLLATVIFNPWWTPPPGSEWARNRKRTPPGPGNPMGRVKLHMDELIYIHGTTSEGRLGAPASHGCIRMANADVVDLARRLHRIASPAMGDAELDAISAPGRNERHTVMARSIRMRVTYQVAALKGERLHVYPDVYGKVGGGFTDLVRREMARGGLDTAQVPSEAFARLRQSAGRGGAAFALAEVPTLRLLPPEPPRERGPRLLGRPVGEPAPPPVPAPAEAAQVADGAAAESSEPVPTTEPEPAPAQPEAAAPEVATPPADRQ
jgi:lipoprotein-anchoring transpeptidase ErfK/SrfK